MGLLPERLALAWARLERVGIIMVLLLLFRRRRCCAQFGIDVRSAGGVAGIVGDPVFRALIAAAGHPQDMFLVLRVLERCLSHRSPPDAADLAPADALWCSWKASRGRSTCCWSSRAAQKVDLARVSILSLVEQYLAVIEGARRVRLELAADWLVMAAWLTWLKSRLLLPAGNAARRRASRRPRCWPPGCATCRRSGRRRPGWARGRCWARTCSPAARRRT